MRRCECRKSSGALASAARIPKRYELCSFDSYFPLNPSQEAAVLRQRLEHPGPLRLRDVEQARLAVAAVASRLAHEGAIELPKSVRFAAAI